MGVGVGKHGEGAARGTSDSDSPGRKGGAPTRGSAIKKQVTSAERLIALSTRRLVSEVCCLPPHADITTRPPAPETTTAGRCPVILRTVRKEREMLPMKLYRATMARHGLTAGTFQRDRATALARGLESTTLFPWSTVTGKGDVGRGQGGQVTRPRAQHLQPPPHTHTGEGTDGLRGQAKSGPRGPSRIPFNRVATPAWRRR